MCMQRVHRWCSAGPILLVILELGIATALPLHNALAGAFLPADRVTMWNPGLRGVGGIPKRTKICSTLNPRGKGLDDTARIQGAINACSMGHVVKLSEGKFLINGGNYLLLRKGITLRGAGPGRTILAKTDGAKASHLSAGPNPSPLIIVGPYRYPSDSPTGWPTDLVGDAVKGSYTVKVARTAGFWVGQIVLLDELSGAAWQKDPLGYGQVWASPDWRVVWQKHNPPHKMDSFATKAFPHTPGSAGSWFSRLDRPTSELKKIASISGNTIRFTTPVHITYRASHKAQLFRFRVPHVVGAGIEDLTVTGGDHSNIRFQSAALSWAENVESTGWLGAGILIDGSFRIELRDFYVHDAAWAQPGGGGYAISLTHGSSEVLVENGIIVRANKLMVANSSGAGSVIAYNYADMSYINSNGKWIEVGLNASHMAGSHHVLFEGNYSHNADSDNTHGNSIFLTFFRNHLRGIRAPFSNQFGGKIDDSAQSGSGPQRTAGLMAYSYWMSFVGNVLGAADKMAGWKYETSFPLGRPGIWMFGWNSFSPYTVDAKVDATALRHGNFDYLTASVKWDPKFASRSLPKSMYLKKKPAFFDKGRGYVWPWVDPIGKTKLHELPAKVRYDAGTPFAQP